MNLLYKLSSIVQFILGPSMYGTYTLLGAWCCLMDTFCSLSDSCSKTCLFFWKDSITCVWFTLSILVWFRHFGTSVFVKQLQAELILILMWFSLLLWCIVVPYIFQASDGYFTLWLLWLVSFFYVQCSGILFSLASLLQYPLLAIIGLTIEISCIFTVDHYWILGMSSGTLYYSCTGLCPTNLEQYLLLVI